jgi:hypothetical protein
MGYSIILNRPCSGRAMGKGQTAEKNIVNHSTKLKMSDQLLDSD